MISPLIRDFEIKDMSLQAIPFCLWCEIKAFLWTLVHMLSAAVSTVDSTDGPRSLQVHTRQQAGGLPTLNGCKGNLHPDALQDTLGFGLVFSACH